MVFHIFDHTCSLGWGEGGVTTWSTLSIRIAPSFGFPALLVISVYVCPFVIHVQLYNFSPQPNYISTSSGFLFFLKNLLVNQQWANTQKLFGDNDSLFVYLLILINTRYVSCSKHPKLVMNSVHQQLIVFNKWDSIWFVPRKNSAQIEDI